MFLKKNFFSCIALFSLIITLNIYGVSLSEDVKHRLVVVNGSGSGYYTKGEIIEIAANMIITPGDHIFFKDWSGSTEVLTSTTQVKTKITMPDYDIYLEANFFKNVAFMKHAFASTEDIITPNPQNSPNNVTDGNLATVWSSKVTTNKMIWIYIDLGKSEDIQGAIIRWLTIYHAKSYGIYVSSDATNWIQVYKNSAGVGGDEKLFANTPISCRYAGILIERANLQNVAITELEFYTKLKLQPTPTPVDELYVSYKNEVESCCSYIGTLTLKNPNSAYEWNGTAFCTWNIEFATTSKVTEVKTSTEKMVNFIQKGALVWINLDSFLPYQQEIKLTITANKDGIFPYPSFFLPHYMRGEDIAYPALSKLPSTWYKEKTNVTSTDLIDNTEKYYETKVIANPNQAIMNQILSQTHLNIGLPNEIDLTSAGLSKIRIWIPNKMAAMALALSYLETGINPNWLCAIGTRENFSFGLIKDFSLPGKKVIIDGVEYTWPFKLHEDGPYQLETITFNSLVKMFPDYFPVNAKHQEFISVLDPSDDTNWVSSTFTSSLSLTLYREMLHAHPGLCYPYFLKKAKDAWGELLFINTINNRGINDFMALKIFPDQLDKAINASDVMKEFKLSDISNSNLIVKTIVNAMNQETENIYNDYVTWAELEKFIDKLRIFYANSIPSDTNWSKMKTDMKNAFNALAKHWDGTHISIRYDLLTLLKIYYAYHPVPQHPRPTGQDWFYTVSNLLPTNNK